MFICLKWIWHQITYNGWYAIKIKQKKQTIYIYKSKTWPKFRCVILRLYFISFFFRQNSENGLCLKKWSLTKYHTSKLELMCLICPTFHIFLSYCQIHYNLSFQHIYIYIYIYIYICVRACVHVCVCVNVCVCVCVLIIINTIDHQLSTISIFIAVVLWSIQLFNSNQYLARFV